MKAYILILSLLIAGTGGVYAQNEAFEGMTKTLGYDKMITPQGIEVTYNKTVHLIFPAAIKYTDLGSSSLIASKVEASENVLRIKAANENFPGETNFSVICADGSFYAFNARYVKEPKILNIEIKNFLQHTGETPNKINVQLSDINGESPALADLILKTIYRNNNREIRHLGCIKFGIQTTLKGLYINNGLLYVHQQIKNTSNVPFTIDFIRFKIVDKKLVKRTAQQEKIISPLRSYNEEIEIGGKSTVRTVYALPKLTLPDDKILTVDIYEKNGGRHQSVRIESTDIELAKTINKLKNQ